MQSNVRNGWPREACDTYSRGLQQETCGLCVWGQPHPCVQDGADSLHAELWPPVCTFIAGVYKTIYKLNAFQSALKISTQNLNNSNCIAK